uniref:Uncharacterized protein n=1 Tax=Rhizophora mucronata TaxID=61149 RepID=A0A2P2PDS9_RHIMU
MDQSFERPARSKKWLLVEKGHRNLRA